MPAVRTPSQPGARRLRLLCRSDQVLHFAEDLTCRQQPVNWRLLAVHPLHRPEHLILHPAEFCSQAVVVGDAGHELLYVGGCGIMRHRCTVQVPQLELTHASAIPRGGPPENPLRQILLRSGAGQTRGTGVLACQIFPWDRRPRLSNPPVGQASSPVRSPVGQASSPVGPSRSLPPIVPARLRLTVQMCYGTSSAVENSVQILLKDSPAVPQECVEMWWMSCSLPSAG